MHISDGFLSPQTCAVCYAATAPFWWKAWKAFSAKMESASIPNVGLAAAFVFLLQMFNVPIPGGTSGHAVGAAIVAIALGPWLAILAVSFTLLLQALMFGDGGILSFGANALNMAVIQSLSAYGIWWMFMRGAVNPGRRRVAVAAFSAAYVSVLLGALATAVELGLQPILHTGINGVPMYFPLGLAITIPAMTGSHLLIGVMEGGITAACVLAIARMPEFQIFPRAGRAVSIQRRLLWGVVAAMALFVPLGIVLPTMAGAGEPWGEWSPDETAQIAGQQAVPAGMGHYTDRYAALVPDYAFGETSGVVSESVHYLGAALIGMLAIMLLFIPLHYLQQSRLQKMRTAQKSSL